MCPLLPTPESARVTAPTELAGRMGIGLSFASAGADKQAVAWCRWRPEGLEQSCEGGGVLGLRRWKGFAEDSVVGSVGQAHGLAAALSSVGSCFR